MGHGLGAVAAILIAIAVGYGIYRLIKARVADGSIELPGHDNSGVGGNGAGGGKGGDNGIIHPAKD